MHPSRVLFRPLTGCVFTGAGARRARNPNMPVSRTIITLKDHLYFAKATAEGSGRNGTVRSNPGDVPLELTMAMPKNTGSRAAGQNPEQLFGMGYASCFLGSLQLMAMAARANKKHLAENAKVHTNVFLGHPSDPNLEGFGLRVVLTVEGCDDNEIIAHAHEHCTYSRALTHGAEAIVNKV
ncbi:OsmC-like protein [Wolfiporia cocos MD-104 SS10]|uniref:OsmC-like protein n=1 Tax=Wolfiporia cocos (strain MD-104) TaxID=742152 RepID=A0A2H3JPD3_WOLCO|nr:OsmC-like protein [Wolfiporia cocos MD-104 SS10]